MSGFTDTEPCPNCGNQAEVQTDYKPFSHTSYECIHCGLSIQPVVSYKNLEELNERREEYDLVPLEILPEQDKAL